MGKLVPPRDIRCKLLTARLELTIPVWQLISEILPICSRWTFLASPLQPSRKPVHGRRHGKLHAERRDHQGDVAGDELRPGDAGARRLCDAADGGAVLPT